MGHRKPGRPRGPARRVFQVRLEPAIIDLIRDGAKRRDLTQADYIVGAVTFFEKKLA